MSGRNVTGYGPGHKKTLLAKLGNSQLHEVSVDELPSPLWMRFGQQPDGSVALTGLVLSAGLPYRLITHRVPCPHPCRQAPHRRASCSTTPTQTSFCAAWPQLGSRLGAVRNDPRNCRLEAYLRGNKHPACRGEPPCASEMNGRRCRLAWRRLRPMTRCEPGPTALIDAC